MGPPLIRYLPTRAAGALGTILVVLAAGEARACPVCFGWTEGRGLVGYYWSLLLLSLLPFAAVTVVGLWVRRLGRRSGGLSAPADGGSGHRPAAG